MEKWFAVFEKNTGRAVSFGTVIANPLPEHLESVFIIEQPKKGVSRWDSSSHSIVPDDAPVDLGITQLAGEYAALKTYRDDIAAIAPADQLAAIDELIAARKASGLQIVKARVTAKTKARTP